MKTSYPKADIKVLLLEGVSQSAVEVFRRAGYSQIEFHEKSLPEAELKARIAEAHIVGIRSRSHLTADVLEQARRLIAGAASASAPTRSTWKRRASRACRYSTRPTPIRAASPSW